jgi:mannose-6-phosphate isomerase
MDKETKLYPFLFEPNLREVVWGGSKLAAWKGLPNDGRPIGESWEVSGLPERPGIVSNGSLAGKKIADIISSCGERVLGKSVAEKYGLELPLLVKFIDAKEDLSIQVHPDDEMARRCHGKRGKTEMWYVLAAEPGASLYAGFKERITPYEYASRVKDGTICDVLARHDVKPGDVFFIPPGRVHAICGGTLLVEVQQSSDVTYRIFDYNRRDLDGNLRQLHTDLAAQAIDYEVQDDYRTKYLDETERAVPVIRSPYFNIRVMEITSAFHRNMLKYDSFIISVCLGGACQICIRGHEDLPPVVLTEGHSCLIPAELADYDIVPLNGEAKILETFINNMDSSLAAKINRFFHISGR